MRAGRFMYSLQSQVDENLANTIEDDDEETKSDTVWDFLN